LNIIKQLVALSTLSVTLSCPAYESRYYDSTTSSDAPIVNELDKLVDDARHCRDGTHFVNYLDDGAFKDYCYNPKGPQVFKKAQLTRHLKPQHNKTTLVIMFKNNVGSNIMEGVKYDPATINRMKEFSRVLEPFVSKLGYKRVLMLTFGASSFMGFYVISDKDYASGRNNLSIGKSVPIHSHRYTAPQY
jgi:hypothetical protein